MNQVIKLPSYDELVNDNEVSLKENKLTFLLNQQPVPSWIKENEGIKYLPIERIEYLLTKIFPKWWVEVKSTQLLANSVVVTVRLFVKNPITGETEYQDGLGASPIQVNKGSSPSDFTQIKSKAIMLAAPMAKTYAVKDAAEMFGKIFGKDIGRKDEISYDSVLKEEITIETLTQLYDETKNKLKSEDQEYARRVLEKKEKESFKKLKNKLLNYKNEKV